MYENPERVLVEDFMEMRKEQIKLVKRVESNILSFVRYAEQRRGEVLAKLEKVKAAPTVDRRGAVVLDPTGKLFSVVRFEPLDDESVNPVTYMLRMEPPYIPHFFLTAAYIYLEKGLVPSALIRTEPVLSLISLFTKGDKLTATTAWIASGAVLVGHFVVGAVSMLPYVPSLLDLPVESDVLYLTNIGYSTEPSEKLGLNVKIDVSDLPSIPEEILSKLGFKSYKDVLDEVVQV